MTEVERIGRYQILGELGRGAMGVVYRAHDPAIGRTVAIKTIRLGTASRGADRDQLMDRLRREAQSAGRLSHPGIVTVYDMIETDDAAYVCMECVEGPTLESVMSGRRAFSRETALAVLRQIADALDYAHSRGVVHRDVKPGNIMLHEDRLVKIADFGIAKILSEDATLTGPMLGTPSYMSPEQIQSRPVGGRSDQFSLAAIAYEILTGEKAFTGYSLASIVYKVCNEPAPAASGINATLGPAVNAVFDRALAKDPAMRFANAAQFVRSLESALSALPEWRPMPRGESQAQPTVAEIPTEPARRPPKSGGTRSLVWLFGLLSFAVVAAIYWVTTPNLNSPVPLTVPAAAPLSAEVAAQKPSPADEPPAQTSELVAQQPGGKPDEAAIGDSPGQPAAAHEFRIETEPDAAAVTIDNIPSFTCVTPCNITLATGRHTLKIERDGYRPSVRIVNVPEQGSAAVSLERRTGTVMVRSNPPGATILVNGKEWSSKTPTMMTLPVGKYRLEFRKEGQRDEESNIEVRDGAVMNLDINWILNQ